MNIVKLLIVATLILFIVYQTILFFKIDNCLDQGDAWDHTKNICIADDNISLTHIQCLSKKGHWNAQSQQCEP